MRALPGLLVSVVISAAMAGCARTSPAEPALLTASVDSEVGLRVGQVLEVGDLPLRIRFEGVASDSRCPADVVCVWEGDAGVVLRIMAGGGAGETVEVHTALEPRDHSAAGYVISLETLAPEPMSGSSIPQAEYLATIRVSTAP
jgi:hypothetical protein